jgi:hypothetical protein
MLQVTTAALDRLATKLAHKKTTDASTLRFSRKKNGWKLHLDEPRPEDSMFVHDGQKVLVLDGEVTEAMTNWRLDVRNTDSGPRLRLSDGSSTS